MADEKPKGDAKPKSEDHFSIIWWILGLFGILWIGWYITGGPERYEQGVDPYIRNDSSTTDDNVIDYYNPETYDVR